MGVPPAARPRTLGIVGSRGIPARYGGFETFAEQAARSLAAAGHEVVVTCEREPGGDPSGLPRSLAEAAPGGPSSDALVKLLHVAAPRLGPFSTIAHDALALWRVSKRVDVVLLLGYGAAPFGLIVRARGRELWINPDGIEWRRAKWSIAARYWLRLMEWFTPRIANRVIADAAAIRDHLLHRHGARAPISVIAYGTRVLDRAPSTSVLQRYGLRPDGYFLVVCRIEPENHLLEIVRGHGASGVLLPLVILGDQTAATPYARALCQAAEASRGAVRFLGPIYEETTVAALRFYARAYCHGHSAGGTNPSLLEALGVGSRLLLHDNPFNREVVGSVPAEWFTSETQVIEGIQRLATQNAGDCSRHRQIAQDRAREAYGWDGVVTALRELLASTAK